MRLLLFIPAIILFLANIPFKFEMKMDEATCKMMKEEMDCGNKGADSKSSCHKGAETEASCHQASETEPASHEPKESQEENTQDNPCMATGITCVCICCFQYTAPASGYTIIDFNLLPEKIALTGFIHSIWEDPQLSPPWQPPDLV